jgi:hypothetical protein
VQSPRALALLAARVQEMKTVVGTAQDACRRSLSEGIANGETGSAVRTKLNAAISQLNNLGTAADASVTEFATAARAGFYHTDYLALAAHLRRRLRSRALVLVLTTLPEQDDEHTLVRAARLLLPQHLQQPLK